MKGISSWIDFILISHHMMIKEMVTFCTIFATWRGVDWKVFKQDVFHLLVIIVSNLSLLQQTEEWIDRYPPSDTPLVVMVLLHFPHLFFTFQGCRFGSHSY